MKKSNTIFASLIAGAVLMTGAATASAHGAVDWSISIGTPFYTVPAPVYRASPVVYAQPRPVVYVSEPVVEYRPAYYPQHRWHDEWHGHHEHDHWHHGDW